MRKRESGEVAYFKIRRWRKKDRINEGEKEERYKGAEGRRGKEGRGCLMPRIITAFNLEGRGFLSFSRGYKGYLEGGEGVAATHRRR